MRQNGLVEVEEKKRTESDVIYLDSRWQMMEINQSTESADGGGFLNFYKPLEYISSVLSFCSIFLDM